MVKMCKYHPELRCYHSCCSLIDGMGSVSVCSLFDGGDFFAWRKVVSRVSVSPFSKHARRK